MFQPKPISKEGIPSALMKAERYRLLNEPGEAESICLDILAIEPANQEALVTLVLSLSDQFREETSSSRTAASRADEFLARLSDEYDRLYYGILRARGSDPSCAQRRRRAALECMRAAARAPSGGAESAGRTAAERIII